MINLACTAENFDNLYQISLLTELLDHNHRFSDLSVEVDSFCKESGSLPQVVKEMLCNSTLFDTRIASNASFNLWSPLSVEKLVLAVHPKDLPVINRELADFVSGFMAGLASQID